MGSGLGIAKLEESKGKGKEIDEEEKDPFADEGEATAAAVTTESANNTAKAHEKWTEVSAVKRWRTGNYVATA